MDAKELTDLLLKYSSGNRGKDAPWWDADRNNPMYEYSFLTEEEVRGMTECAEQCSAEALSAPAGTAGFTVFHLLVWCGLYDAARKALQKGVDADIPGTGAHGGITALMIACCRANGGMVRLLLEHGADSALCDAEGRNAYHYLAGKRVKDMVTSYESQRRTMGQREQIAELLSGEINARDAQGLTPLESLLQSENSNFSWALSKIYIAKGADTHTVDEAGNSLLMKAVKNRHLTAALALMEDKDLLNMPNQEGKTPLHLAVENYNLELCMALLDKRADKNAADAGGRTPKDTALARNDEEYRQVFTSGRLKLNTLSRLTSNAFAGFSDDERDRLSMALYLADKLIREADTDDDEEMGLILNILRNALMNDEKCQVLDSLAKAGIDLTAPIHAGGSVQCIRDYCLGGNFGVKTIQKFIDLGLDMDEALLKGRTPANIVASQPERNMMFGQKDDYFEKAAAFFSPESMMQPDDNGTTAMHEAARCNHVDMLRVMIEKGADVNIAQDEPADAGNTPLHVACLHGNSKAAELLMASGADDTIQNVKGETPAHLAVMKNRFGRDLNAERQKELLEALQHVDIPDSNGRTPLMLLQYQSLNTKMDVLPVLLDKGVDVNKKDNAGDTALTITTANQSYKGVVKELVRAGADINAENRNGDTALHFALRYGDQESSIFLIKKGADYNHANNRGVTPVQIAVEKGYDTVLSLMTDIG